MFINVLTQKQKKKVLMASLDVRRPAAQEQLAVLGVQAGVATLPIVPGEPPVAIAKRAVAPAAPQVVRLPTVHIVARRPAALVAALAR